MIEPKDDEKVQCSERIQSTNDHIPYQLRMSLHHFPSYTEKKTNNDKNMQISPLASS